ncbi:Putative B3 domain-containing protein Os03g0621600 [Linum perenne]
MARGRRRSSSSTGLDESEVRFFKIVVEESMQIKKLMVPKSFTRKYWRHAPTRATLALPGCKTWEMEVFKDGDRCMWLRAGWDAFARFYSLVPGSLLHFTYLGGSTFFVRVYALNCMEIKYPLAVFDSSSSSSSDSEADEDVPVEVSDYQEDEETEDEEEEEEDDEDEDFEQTPRSPVHRRGKEKMGNSSSRGRHAEIPEFVATMTRTYLKLYQAHIPGEFSKKYIAESDDRVILKIGNRTWDAKLNRQGTKVRYPKFSSGWVQFARDNTLKFLCSPLYISVPKASYSFSKLANKTLQSTSQQQSLISTGFWEMDARGSNDSEEPISFFKVIIRDSLRAKKLMLPKRFTKTYWRNAPTRATLALPGQRTWEMEVFKDAARCMWLTVGWEAFAGFYSLDHGSFLHFTYLGGSTFFVRVYALDCMQIKYPVAVSDSSSSRDSEADEGGSFEVSDYQEEEETDDEEEEEEDFEHLPRNHVLRRGKEKMGDSSSQRGHAELPEFVANVTPTYLKLYQAHIPGKFSKKYIADTDDLVILKIGNKTWNAKLNRQGGKFRYPKLSSGWIQFARDNAIKVGDKCVFQLLKRIPVLVFKVVIIRA